MIISLSTKLPLPAHEAWSLLNQKDTFLYITRGATRYTGTDSWPASLMACDTQIETTVHPLSVLPGVAHTFRIVRNDCEKMEI